MRKTRAATTCSIPRPAPFSTRTRLSITRRVWASMPAGKGAPSLFGSVGICPVRNAHPSTSTACENGAAGVGAPGIIMNRAALIECLSARFRHALLRLYEAQREFVGRDLRFARRYVARIGGVAQKIAFGFEDEPCLPDFVDNHRLLDAMQCLALGYAGSAPARVIDHDEVSAWLQRCEEPLVHLRAIDRKIRDVVVVEDERDQIQL